MLKLLIVLLFFIKFVCCKTEIPIGAIFYDDIENEEIEIAFLAAIQKVNLQERNYEFVPKIKYISSTNSYKAEKAVCQLIRSGVAAIFGSGPKDSGIVQSICDYLKIPNIIAHWVPEPTRFLPQIKNMTINLYPDSNTLARAFSEIIVDNNWSGYTIIYDTDEGLMRLKDVIGIHGPEDKPITVRKLGSERKNYSVLKKIRESGSSDIIMDVETNNIVTILKQAKYLNLLGYYERFIITSLNTHTLDFDEIQLENSNISSFRLFDPYSPEVIKNINDWESTDQSDYQTNIMSSKHTTVEAALMYDAVKLFAKAYKECNRREEITTRSLSCNNNEEWEYGQTIVNEMKMIKIDGITGPIMINPDGQRILFELDITEFSKKIGFRNIGFWHPSKGINYTRTQMEISEIAKDSLQHKVVTVASRIGEPFLRKRIPKDGETLVGNERYEGYSLDLVEEISKILNFTYKFDLVPDNNFGALVPETNEWNGVVRHIMDRKADIGVCDLTITHERRTVVDFTMPFMTLGISILYTVPHKEPPDLFSFLSPLSKEVWLYTASAYLAVSLLIFILARMAGEEWQNPHPCNHTIEELENIWNIKNSAWVTVGSIMGQGSDLLPKAKTTRIVCGMWFFFALIMLASYTANLAAFLTNDLMEKTIENVNQLGSQSTVKYGVVLRGSTLSFFQHSNNSLYQKMWATMENEKPSVFTETNEQGADRVAKSKRKFAFFMESSIIDYMKEQNCALTKIGGTLDTKGYGIALPMNSIYRKEFNAAILKLQEHGSLDVLKKKWWRNKVDGGTCSGDNKKKSDTTELGVAQVGGVFVILLIGCVTGLFIGVIEFLWNVRKVAVQQKLTPWKAFKQEFKFALKVNIRTKAVHISLYEHTPRSRSSTIPRSNDIIID